MYHKALCSFSNYYFSKVRSWSGNEDASGLGYFHYKIYFIEAVEVSLIFKTVFITCASENNQVRFYIILQEGLQGPDDVAQQSAKCAMCYVAGSVFCRQRSIALFLLASSLMF